MAVKTIATCDKCGNGEVFEGGRTNSEMCDTLCSYYGWRIIDEYHGKLLCPNCRDDEEEEAK
jgi:predicted RNA-binding Zn-ribbon protein involved in translation (DUF1610 family)